MSITPNAALRNGDHTPKRSIGRQRKQTSTPEEIAAATAKVIEKRQLDGQPIPAWVHIDALAGDEPSAADLAAILPTEEWPTLPADEAPAEAPQPAVEVPAVAEVEAPEAPEPAPEASWPAPSWRDHNPPLCDHLTWIDSEGIQHGLTIRADTLDELVRNLTAVKALIASAKAAAAKNAAPQQPAPVAPVAEPQLSSRRCELHDAPMFKAVSKKTGKLYASHMTAEGERCFGRKA